MKGVGKAVLLLCMAVALLAGRASGQTKVPPATADIKENHILLDWDTFKKITGFKEGPPEPPEKKGYFTVAWKDVEELLNIKIDKVGTATLELPWQEFKRLLEWSLEQKQKEKDKDKPVPPAEYIVSSMNYTGDISKDGALLTAEARVSVLQEKGWKRIPLLPSQVALKSVTLPPGAYFNLSGTSYELVTDKSGEMMVKTEFAAAAIEQTGSYKVTFPRMKSGTCVLDLTIDRKDVELNIEGAQVVTKQVAGETTKILAYLPATTSTVAVSWQRAIPEIEKVPPRIYAETRTLAAIGEGIVACREKLNFNILHAGAQNLDVELPPGVSILEVTGQRIRDWRVKDNVLSVLLEFEATGTYTLDVSYEKNLGAAATVDIPILHAKNAVREKGFIGVVALSNVEVVSPTQSGATAIDVRELPSDIMTMTGQPILLAYRYVTSAVTIALSVKKHEDVDVLVTLVDAAAFTAMETTDGRRITRVIYNVRNNRNQFLRLAMPEGADVWSALVSGRTIRPAKDEQGRVLIPLVRSDSGARALASFPVELVYVEKGAEPGKKGTLTVKLPVCDQPITHLMYNIYLPADREYKNWAGNLKKVDAFTRLSTVQYGAAGPVSSVDAEKQARQTAADIQARMEQEAVASGVTPIRVELPLTGTLCLLEKILVLGDTLSFTVEYQEKSRSRGLWWR